MPTLSGSSNQTRRWFLGSLSADEVYAVTAYVLYLNGIVSEGEALSQATLPRVTMPNRHGFTRP